MRFSYWIAAGMTAGFLSGMVVPSQGFSELPRENAIDVLVCTKLAEHGLTPAASCPDEVFFRRIYLDVIGTLPTAEETLRFLGDTRPDKRSRWLDELLDRDEYALYWAMKWSNLLRVKAEFPINLWPNAVQAYHRWVYEALKKNMPYDEFVRALLTSSGSNFRVPPVNFYRAIQGREPSSIAAAVALTFMGTRLDAWPEEQQKNMEVFFSRIAYKGTEEWKEEIVCLDATSSEPLNVAFPDGTPLQIPAGQDPRQLFAAWLIAPDNPWFARNIVNRVWFWLFGRGIIHEPDDIRSDNPPVNPELLAYLEKEFVRSGYDLKQLYRLILNSKSYQQSSTLTPYSTQAEKYFACYPIRRIEAEVLSDALQSLFGPGESYSSLIPEPFTFIPNYTRTIALADGSTTNAFLETFGRPSRDTGLENERNHQTTAAQRLYLINSSEVQKRIAGNKRRWAIPRKGGKGRMGQSVRQIFVEILSRYPTQEEMALIRAYGKGSGTTPSQAAEDLVWALINSKEFLYKH